MEIGRITSTISNIRSVPRNYDQERLQSWQNCRTTNRQDSFKACDNCKDRFKCWTASRPHSIFSDDDLYYAGLSLERLRKGMSIHAVTLDEVAKRFTNLSYALCKEYVKNNEQDSISR